MRRQTLAVSLGIYTISTDQQVEKGFTFSWFSQIPGIQRSGERRPSMILGPAEPLHLIYPLTIHRTCPRPRRLSD